MENIIAKSSKGEGILPMKQSKEIEKKKSDEQKAIECCNFIKNAFLIDGDVKMVFSSDKPVASNFYFKCNDSKRGKIFVAYGFL